MDQTTQIQHTTPLTDAIPNTDAQPTTVLNGPPATSTGAPGDAFAITSFVLALVSVVSGHFFVPPILGLIFGIIAKRRVTTMPGLANWGIGISIAILSVWVLIAGFAAAVAFFGIVSSMVWY